MARKQTRRSISVNRSVFEASKALAEQKRTSLSRMTEDALRVVLAAQGSPQLKAAFDAMLSSADIAIDESGNLKVAS
jgi:hypothetical protein